MQEYLAFTRREEYIGPLAEVCSERSGAASNVAIPPVDANPEAHICALYAGELNMMEGQIIVDVPPHVTLGNRPSQYVLYRGQSANHANKPTVPMHTPPTVGVGTTSTWTSRSSRHTGKTCQCHANIRDRRQQKSGGEEESTCTAVSVW